MANELQGKRVAFLFTEGVEQVELTEPLTAVREAGADVDLVSLDTGDVQMFHHLDNVGRVPRPLRRGTRRQLS
jgi:protease I